MSAPQLRWPRIVDRQEWDDARGVLLQQVARAEFDEWTRDGVERNRRVARG